MSYNEKRAISGEYPDPVFNYSKALVSMGCAPAMKEGTAVDRHRPEAGLV